MSDRLREPFQPSRFVAAPGSDVEKDIHPGSKPREIPVAHSTAVAYSSKVAEQTQPSTSWDRIGGCSNAGRRTEGTGT